MSSLRPVHAVYVAIFSLVVGVICAVVGTQEDDSFLKGLAVVMFILSGINLVMAWRLHRVLER